MMYFEFTKYFFLANSSKVIAVRLILAFIFGILSPKTCESYFLDMIDVEFIKNFLLADSCKYIAVRLISASWAQKRLIPTF